MPRPTWLCIRTQTPAASTMASPSHARPTPSRRCTSSRSRALCPIRRAAKPAVPATSIHPARAVRKAQPARITTGSLDRVAGVAFRAPFFPERPVLLPPLPLPLPALGLPPPRLPPPPAFPRPEPLAPPRPLAPARELALLPPERFAELTSPVPPFPVRALPPEGVAPAERPLPAPPERGAAERPPGPASRDPAPLPPRPEPTGRAEP